MDLENKKTRIILVSLATAIMVIVLFFYFKDDSKQESQKTVDKYTRTGKTDRDSNLERAKNKAQKEYERDVKNYSFADYNRNQIEKEPETLQKEENESYIEENKEIETKPTQEILEEQKKVATAPSGTVIKKSNVSPKKELIENKSVETVNPTFTEQPQRRTGFAGSSGAKDGNASANSTVPNSHNIKAAVLQTKKIKQGDIILIRNTEEFILDSKKIPVNTLIAGTTSFTGSRLSITISAIPYGDESLPCNLTAYDLDGNKGLKLNRDIDYELKGDVTNTAISEAAQVVRVPYIGNMARQIGTKTVNDPTITIEQGQKMYLRVN